MATKAEREAAAKAAAEAEAAAKAAVEAEAAANDEDILGEDEDEAEAEAEVAVEGEVLRTVTNTHPTKNPLRIAGKIIPHGGTLTLTDAHLENEKLMKVITHQSAIGTIKLS